MDPAIISEKSGKLGEENVKKISIIIPCYNVEQYMDRCLNGIIVQTIGMQELEVICVNDASTDGTLKRLQEWEQKYPELIHIIDCKQNGRLGKARNIGLEHANGEYVMFLDADDWMESDAYELLYQKAEQYNCDIVRCYMIRDPGEKDLWEDRSRREKEDFLLVIDQMEERKKFMVSDLMDNGCCNKLYRRGFLKQHKLRFPEGKTYEDIYWGMISYLYAKTVYFCNENLYHYYINLNSIVLKKDQDYHMDIFDTTKMMWEECKRRGAMEHYQKEMEINFLIYYYLGGLKMLALRYTKLQYSAYQKMCQEVREIIPEYKKNPYLTQILDPMQQLQVELIDKDITEAEFAQIVKIIQKG